MTAIEAGRPGASRAVTLRRKILTGYGLWLGFMGLVVAWAVANLVSLGTASSAVLSDNYRSIRAADHMVSALARQETAALLVLLGGHDPGKRRLLEAEADFLLWLGRAEDNVTVDGEVRLLRTIRTRYAEWSRGIHALADIAPGEPLDDARAALDRQLPGLREACAALGDLNETAMRSAGRRAERVARRAIWSTGVVAGVALLAGLGLTLLLIGRVAGPVGRVAEASRRIAAGDYTVRLPIESGDELGRLAAEFNQMAGELDRYRRLNVEELISERNKGEAILRTIDDGLVVFDTGLRVTGLNPAARRFLGLDDAPPSVLRLADVVRDEAVRGLVAGAVRTGERPDIPEEQRILSVAEGAGARHYLFSITPIRGGEGGLNGIVLLLRDVTRLREVERLKSEFVMAASHELRTPLTSLGMSIDLLLERVAPGLQDRDRELLRAAHEEVHRMKVLINDLLDLSKIEAGRIHLSFAATAVAKLFDDVRRIFENQLDMKQVELRVAIGEDLPPVRADSNKIRWVLTNLVSNALRYVEREGRIELGARLLGPRVHVWVRDDGPGIPAEYQSRIFHEFVHVEGREPGGSGLGLTICKEIVRAHSGAIWLESKPGEGCTFTFTLPVAAPAGRRT